MKKQLFFLIIIMLMVKSVWASESQLKDPPGYNYGYGPYGNPLVATAPSESRTLDKLNPGKEAIKTGEAKGREVYVVDKSSCVCLCPLNIDVKITPILHGITARLSFGLFGNADSTTTEENNNDDSVHQHPYVAIEEDKEKQA